MTATGTAAASMPLHARQTNSVVDSIRIIQTVNLVSRAWAFKILALSWRFASGLNDRQLAMAGVPSWRRNHRNARILHETLRHV